MAEHHWTTFATEPVKRLVELLPSQDINSYRETMMSLCGCLATTIATSLENENNRGKPIYIACSVEDADFLAKGLLTSLEKTFSEIRFACFWNKSTIEPDGVEDFEFSPILKQYKEMAANQECILIVVKSIISGACVVATNINNLMTELNPISIYIAAPVMLDNADKKLKSQFPTKYQSRFSFISFAIDNQKDQNGMILPGIGGSVYERYGFASEADKNIYLPTIVKTRRKTYAQT